MSQEPLLEDRFLYRYENRRVAIMGGWEGDDYQGSEVRVYGSKFKVISETNCGYWIEFFFKKKWVSKSARKRFAHINIDEAKESFVKRKERQIKIYQSKVGDAKKAIWLIKNTNL